MYMYVYVCMYTLIICIYVCMLLPLAIQLTILLSNRVYIEIRAVYHTYTYTHTYIHQLLAFQFCPVLERGRVGALLIVRATADTASVIGKAAPRILLTHTHIHTYIHSA